jgi:hypothetical protein
MLVDRAMMLVVAVLFHGPMVVIVVPLPGTIPVVVAFTRVVPAALITGPVAVFNAVVFAVLFLMMPVRRIPMVVVMNFMVGMALIVFLVVTVFSAVRPGTGREHQQQDSRQDTDHPNFRFHWTTSFVFEVVWIDGHGR